MATLSGLVTLFPEFTGVASTHAAYVQGHLDQAALVCGATPWADLLDMATYYTAAHSLSMSPFGTQARLASPTAETIYSARLGELRATLPTHGLLV
jgi:hypothetical protein